MQISFSIFSEMSHIALTASPTVVAFHRGAKQWSTLFPSSWRSRGINPSSFLNSTRKRLPLRFFASEKNGVNGGVVDEISETVKAHTDFVWPDNKKPRVCILGGGFGGLYTALRLESLQWPEDKKPHVSIRTFKFNSVLSSVWKLMQNL
ncbi:alternative NAD(P)H-ubiquinone oxidoreductase C1, chloroplastic/mitochondrial isoform X1 [Lathyrus oleraceus]|uniref:alternative NAD(P)H-ubiquinone oxidoreductase C1, chloroplastic/mitochondrial isoform X1 n=1 Tax=Pisum sativum TaxID=3888 RepID=UPI0021D31050|nr:alternative NAD(P)H-ubiquinone oxidoreductase C1, chloroplastic/mitochondrial-like isoform X1 [Pisum sativum]